MDELIQKEIALHQFEIRTDKGEASRLLHPDFLEVGKSGKTFDFNLIMESMSKEKPTGSVVHSQDYECISLEANTNLLLYRSAVINNDGAIGSYAKRSSVWVKFKNEWKLRYHQGTPCEEFQLSK
jgi:hypothetical protein